MEDELTKKLVRQLIPEEVLLSFDIVDIDDSSSDELIISMVEKKSQVPNTRKDIVLNGYLKEIELTHFPVNGKQCFLKLKRRRWKYKGDNNPIEHFYNNYDYAVGGTKATRAFGSFLKGFNA